MSLIGWIEASSWNLTRHCLILGFLVVTGLIRVSLILKNRRKWVNRPTTPDAMDDLANEPKLQEINSKVSLFHLICVRSNLHAPPVIVY